MEHKMPCHAILLKCHDRGKVIMSVALSRRGPDRSAQRQAGIRPRSMPRGLYGKDRLTTGRSVRLARKQAHNIGQEVIWWAWQLEREAPCRPPKQSFGFFCYLYPIKFAMEVVGGMRKDSSFRPHNTLAQRSN